MKLAYLFLSFASTNIFMAKVDAAASFNPAVFCSRIASDVKVCATASYTSPSPMAFPNGTTVYAGGYSTSYTIVKGLMEGEIFAGNPVNDAGITINVVRDDSNMCTVSVSLNDTNAVVCKSCKYCGEDSYKADCSNVKNGRMMTMCESTEDDDVFFPLTALALPKMNVPVRAPFAGPRRSPVAEPRRSPVAEPRRPPVAGPRRSPVSEPRRPPVAGPRRPPVAEPRRSPVAEPRRTPVAEPRRPPVAGPRRSPVAEVRDAPAAVPRRAPVAEPRRAPVAEPRRAPVAEPRRSPVAEPRRAPAAEPRRSPVAEPRRAPVAEPRRSPVAEPRRAPVKAQIKAPSTSSD